MTQYGSIEHALAMKKIVDEQAPQLRPFIKSFHEEGLIEGWRAILSVQILTPKASASDGTSPKRI